MLPAIDSTPVDRLTELVLELLDAHADTVGLARDLDGDPEWAAHLAYLRDLQRVARESLAHLVAGAVSGHAAA